MHNRTECHELRELRDHVSESVNSLELCASCERICECEQVLANEAVPVWLCIGCRLEFSYRLERLSGMPVSLSSCLNRR
jgi:hypothetical protein